LWDVIVAQEPYPTGDAHEGGDNDARVLSQIANNKHTIGITLAAEHISGVQRPHITGSIQSLKVLMPRWDSEKNEAEFVRYTGDAKVNVHYELSLDIVLNDPRLGTPIHLIGGLRHFSAKAKRAVEALETRCRELG
jgi:hypothetical protein